MKVHLICLKNKHFKILPFLQPKAAWFTPLFILILPSEAAWNECFLSLHTVALQIFEEEDRGKLTFAKFFNWSIPSMTVNLPTHSSSPFSAPITQTFFSACRSPTVPLAVFMGSFSRFTLLYSVQSKMPSTVRCIVIFMYPKNKQNPLPIKLWHDINYKAHFIFRDVKMWKNCVLESMKYSKVVVSF